MHNSIHSVKFKVPFSAYIIIDSNVDLDNDSYCIYPCVEDVFINILDERTLSKSVTLFLFAHKTTLIKKVRKLTNSFVFYTSDRNEEMAKIEFDIANNKLIVTSTDKPYNDGVGEAFKVDLLNADGSIAKSSTINKNGKEVQLIIKSSNMDSIEVGNILELKYLNPALVEISKFPTDTGKVISLTGTSKKLILTQNGLQVKNTNLPNEFILFNFNDKEMARVAFDTGSNKLIVTSTSRVYEANDAVAFIFALISNNGAFKNQFNDLDFQVGDIIRLIYTNRNKIKLTNYPNQGVQYTMLELDSQSFKITQSGIIPNLLPNDIILNGNSNNPILTIKMDILFKMFIVTSTGSVTSPGGTNYFKATSYKADGTELASKIIPGNSNGSAFRNNFSGKKFEFGGVLKLQYEDTSKVKITNFERQGQTHTPTGREEQYTITENGLVPKP